jgi:hypothetical protein
MKYKYYMACRLWLSDWAVVYLGQGGQWTVGVVCGLDESYVEQLHVELAVGNVV